MAVVAAGGTVRANPRGREMGIARKIALTPEGRGHPLYAGKGSVFDAFISHVDEITHLPGMEPDDSLYFRDLYDSLVRSSDLIDSYRDLLSGATDMYLSTVANRQGEISKQLTIIATIFLPLSFLTGFFGQNFGWLVQRIGSFAAFWGLGVGSLLVSCVALFAWFRQRGWL